MDDPLLHPPVLSMFIRRMLTKMSTQMTIQTMMSVILTDRVRPFDAPQLIDHLTLLPRGISKFRETAFPLNYMSQLWGKMKLLERSENLMTTATTPTLMMILKLSNLRLAMYLSQRAILSNHVA
jgi:hypothetical protein